MYPRENTENFQLSRTLDSYFFGIWGNVTRNPRYLFILNRHKVVDFADCGMMCTVPKPLGLDNVAIRMILDTSIYSTLPYENIKVDSHVSIIGGVISLDLMELPDGPKKINSWTIRSCILLFNQVLSPNGMIKSLPYPNIIKQEKDEEEVDSAVWATQITYIIEPLAFIDRSAKIVFWDKTNQIWSNNDIKDEEFDRGFHFFI